MAHGILEHKANNMNLPIEVDSAATSSYHIGQSPDSRAISKCAQMGIDISGQRGRQFKSDDFDRFDKIYVMDINNHEDILRLARNEVDKRKVELILNTIYAGENMSVPDPYYGGEEDFDNAFKLLDIACDKILEEITNEH